MSIDAVPEIEHREVIKQVPEVEAQFVEKRTCTDDGRSGDNVKDVREM